LANTFIGGGVGRKDQVRNPAVHLLLIGLAGLTACSSAPNALEQVISRAEVVEAYVDTGLSDAVAECIAGIGSRNFEMAELDPRIEMDLVDRPLLDELIISCVNAERLNTPTFDEPPSLAFSSEPDVFGDDRELDELWTACENADGVACDQLFESAPVGSSYEQFGVTCGGRPEILDCQELVPDDS
jgi:hypothetical protein